MDTGTGTTVFYTLVVVFTITSLVLVACKQSSSAVIVSSVTVLALILALIAQDANSCEDETVVVVDNRSSPAPIETSSPTIQRPTIRPKPRPVRASFNQERQYTPPVANPEAVAPVTNNAYVGPRKRHHLPPPRMSQECGSTKLVLPITMEGEEPYGPRANDIDTDNIASCGGGLKTVPNLPPMPGLAQPPGESIWRLPEYPVEQSSREETIAAVVSGLPECCQQTPQQVIRNQGLYGVKGNLSCDLLKRSAVADRGFLEPLGARNAFLAYNSYDQLHSKDPWLIPVNKNQPE
jgi:hypothetical protein